MSAMRLGVETCAYQNNKRDCGRSWVSFVKLD